MRPERYYYHQKSSKSSRKSRSRSPYRRRNDEYDQFRRDSLKRQQEKHKKRSRSRSKTRYSNRQQSSKTKEKHGEKVKEKLTEKEEVKQELSDNEDLDFDIKDEEENEEVIIERRRKERENLLKQLQMTQQDSQTYQQSPQNKDTLSDDDSEDIVQFDFETSIIDKEESVSKNQTQNQLQTDADDLLESCNKSKMKEINEKSRVFDMFADDDNDFHIEKQINNEKTQKNQVDNPNLADNWDDHEGYYSNVSKYSLKIKSKFNLYFKRLT